MELYLSTVKKSTQIPKKKNCKIIKVALISYTWPKLVLDISFEGSANLDMVVKGIGTTLGTTAILGGAHRIQHGEVKIGQIAPGGFQQIK